MKKFFSEFKKFITRGNVIDMAVGVIVGSSFTAIVNGLCNFILKPLTNWLLAVIFSSNSLSELYTVLKPATVIDEGGNEVLDLANSIYIDWGSFISAIINFLLIAVVLFTIVKIINSARANHEKMTNLVINGKVTKEEKKEMKALGYDFRSDADIEVYRAQKKADADKAAAEAAEAAAIERANNPTTEDLLKDIRELLKNK